MKKHLNIFGIETEVESDNHSFLEMVEQSLCFFREDNDKNDQLIENYKLKITFLSKETIDYELARSEYSKIGNNAYLHENNYLFCDGRLIVKIFFADDEMHVLARYRVPKKFKSWVRDNIFQKFICRRIDLFPIIRMLILFPIFIILEDKKMIFLLHGSAVQYKNQGIIFAGLGSIGKSISALSLTLDKNAKFLTDNFLLFDKKYIYPFPEYIRLGDDKLKLIRNISKLGESFLRRYKRNYYMLDEDFISGRITPRLMFIPRLSDERCIKKIPAEIAIDRLLLSNDHVKEFHSYHHSGLLYYGYCRTTSIYKQRMKTLENLLSKLSIYEISINKLSLPPADYIEDIIRDVS